VTTHAEKTPRPPPRRAARLNEQSQPNGNQGKTNGSNQNFGVIIRHTSESGSTYNAIYSKSAAADKRPAFAIE